MVRYTEEQKAQALQYMAENGVQKAKEELGISVQTLYKWRNGGAAPKAGQKRGRKPSKEVAALLKDDGGAVQKIAQLEKENLALRTQNEKLKKAIQSFLD